MKTLTKLLALGGGIAAVRYFQNRHAARGSLRDIATRSGIADVDPEALVPVVEAIDPDANEAAHRDIVDQRERLP